MFEFIKYHITMNDENTFMLKRLDLLEMFGLTIEQTKELFAIVRRTNYFKHLEFLALPNPYFTPPTREQNPSEEYMSLILDTLDEARQLQLYTFNSPDVTIHDDG